MNLHSQFAWVRAAGLAAVLGLVACDSGTPDTKKTEPTKTPEDIKKAPTDPAKADPSKSDAIPGDIKAADSAGAADAKADPTKAGDIKAGDPAGAPADPTKAGDPAADAKASDAKNAADAKAAGDAKNAADAKAGDSKSTAGSKPKEPATPAIDAKPLYDKYCKVCHAADGKGTEAMKKNDIPDMTDKAWQSGHSKQKVVDVLNKGVDGTKMKSFKEKLKPEEIDAVAAYVKKLK